MEKGISVGNEISKETIEATSEAIRAIIESGYSSHMDQETVRHALSVLGKVGSIDNVTISGNSVGNTEGKCKC